MELAALTKRPEIGIISSFERSNEYEYENQ